MPQVSILRPGKARTYIRKEPSPSTLRREAGVSQAAEKLVQRAVLKGHEFTRADKSIGLMSALAAEGCISQFSSELLTFSAACSTPARNNRPNTGFSRGGKRRHLSPPSRRPHPKPAANNASKTGHLFSESAEPWTPNSQIETGFPRMGVCQDEYNQRQKRLPFLTGSVCVVGSVLAAA